MSTFLSRRAALVMLAVVVVAPVVTGCGHRGLAVGAAGDAAGTGGSVPAATLATPSPRPTAGPAVPASAGPATPSTGPAETPAALASPAPAVTPDLGSIQSLLDHLDAALGADATADTDEGSPQ